MRSLTPGARVKDRKAMTTKQLEIIEAESNRTGPGDAAVFHGDDEVAALAAAVAQLKLIPQCICGKLVVDGTTEMSGTCDECWQKAKRDCAAAADAARGEKA